MLKRDCFHSNPVAEPAPRRGVKRNEFLPFAECLIGDEEIADVAATCRSGWLTTGPKTHRFEQEFKVAVEAPAALALSSCTSALHLALKVLGIGPGDAVITTPMTFCAAANVIEHVGAVPVLVDVRPGTLQIDSERIRERLDTWNPEAEGARIKALMPVHLYGHPCNLDAIIGIARDHGLAVIEDAAHAFPAKHRGRTIGSMAASSPVPLLTCFSFYAVKNMTTAEGGMLTGERDLIEEARIWSRHGMTRDSAERYRANDAWHYDVVHPGFKCNMTDLQAALGLHQLARIPSFQARRREIANRYTQAFSQLEAVEVPPCEPEVEHAWHLYVIRLHLHKLKIDRSGFIRALGKRNIGASVHFIPIHRHAYYRKKYGYEPNCFSVANGEFERIVSLPLYPKMSDRDVDDVISAVSDIVTEHAYSRC